MGGEVAEQCVHVAGDLISRRVELAREGRHRGVQGGPLFEQFPEARTGVVQLVDAVGREADEDSGVAKAARDNVGGGTG